MSDAEILSDLGLIGRGSWIKASPAFPVRSDCKNCGKEVVWNLSGEILSWVHFASDLLDCEPEDITKTSVYGPWWEND